MRQRKKAGREQHFGMEESRQASDAQGSRCGSHSIFGRQGRLLSLLLAASLSLAPLSVYATNAGIEDSKRKIEENKEKMKELQGQQSQIEDKLAELNQLKSDAAAYIQKLDGELASLETQIQSLNKQMTEKQAEIDATSKALAAARETEAAQYASMKLRIKYMYEQGDMSYLDMLVESSSFSDLLNKAEYIQQVSAYDRKKLNEYVAIREDVAAKEAELESEYAALGSMKQQAEERQGDVEKLQADKQKELTAYNTKIQDANADLGEMQASIAGIQAAIQAEENNIAAIEAEQRRKEEEAKKKAEASGKTYETKRLGDQQFTWPLPSSSRITSEFGSRESPTEGASSNHKGIDISAPTGSRIVAAESGSVVIATYSASAGNYVMINHGDGVYSVYMHMSSIAVSVGQSVSKGDTVGAVGSTGYSTGPHLHFGLRVNGSYVNPRSYVSP